MTTFFTKIITLATLLIVGSGSILSIGGVMAANDQPFQIIPKAEEDFAEDVIELQENEGNFRNKYNDIGDGYSEEKDLGSALSSGIVTRDTILILASRVVKIISQMGLVIGSLMFIYAGYLYGISVFAGDETSKANDAMKNAVIGLVIIIFSYAINRIVLFAFVT